MNTTVIVKPLATGDDVARAERGVDVSLFAQLAFARPGTSTAVAQGRHLALLPTESLELDLSDPLQRQFGDYELLELIGEGGMGVVYRARQTGLDREVAVKLLAAGVWASAEFVERFRREAQNAARMQHPNIVPVYEVGSHDEMQFFSMRLVRGPSLAAELQRAGKLAPRRAAELLRTIAEAVDYAHRLGVLHLDLKPGNVLLDENGTAHVADFGLARRLDSALVADSDEVSGTPSYMAPEQASPRTARITPATDIWGLGAIGYEMVTGEAPFVAKSPQETLKLVVEGSLRSPRRHVPNLPRDLEAIILKCMAYQGSERYASARGLAEDLGRFLEGRAVRARPLHILQRIGRWARREPKLAIAAGCAIAALVIGLLATAAQWRRADANADAARQNLWSTRAQTAQQALSEGDGFHSLRPLIANLTEMEAAGRHDEARIERERIGTILANAPQLLDLIRLPSGETATSVALAPDGRHFAVASAHGEWGGPSHQVRLYALDTLREVWSSSADNRSFLRGAGDAYAPLGNLHYSADGRFILASLIEQPVMPAPRWSDMIAFDARDGHVLWPQALANQFADIVYDESARYALVRFRSDKSRRWPDTAQFYAVDGWRPVGPHHSVATTLAADLWMPAPGGDAWLGTRNSTNLALYEVPSLKPRWQLSLPPTSLVRAWNFSRDGRRIALGSVDGAVRIVDTSNGQAVLIGSTSSERVQSVDLSADGKALAAIDELGQLWVWEVPSGRALSAPVPFVGATDGARLRFFGNAVFGGGLLDSGNAQLGYAAVMPRSPFNIATGRAPVQLRGNNFGTAFDVSHRASRLVMGAVDGLVEVWQPSPSPVLDVRAAPLAPDVQTFDGNRVVAVDGNTARIVDPVHDKPLSPPLRHPEPLRFADLSPDGRRLVTIAGRTVRVIDTDTWRLRGSPIVLPQTPQRALFAQSAPVLVLTTNDYEGDTRRELIQRVDLDHGTLLSAFHSDALTDLRIDAQARYALAATWNSATHVPTGLQRIRLENGSASCTPELGESWGSFAMAADGLSAWFTTGQGAQLLLQRWDLDACRKIAVTALPEAHEDVVLKARSNGGVAIHRGGNSALVLVGPDGEREAALGEPIANSMHTFALSADGARAAFATRNAVHLIDARQGRRLSAALGGPIMAGDDAIAKLAFAPDGMRLLARTINGRWLFLDLPRTDMDSAALGRLVRVLDPQARQSLADADIAAVRESLHSSASRPLESNAPVAPIVFPAAADAQEDARFVTLDLRRAINIPLVGMAWPEPFGRGDQPTLAPGPQRFLGVDYRVDGGVQLSAGGTATSLGPELHRSAVVPVAGIIARRVHVLAFMHTPMEHGIPPRTFARVVLIGADGRETALEIRTLRDVVTDGNPNRAASTARIAFVGIPSAHIRNGLADDPVSATYAVTLDVPASVGPIRGLRFDAPQGPMEAPLLYAATLERTAADARSEGKSP
ncbi:MAG: protein kinase [Proteobacteria bacterium]|nr:protein kinase [Pseudomonadota bacterium]